MPDISAEREMASINETSTVNILDHSNDEHKRDYQTGSILYTGNTTRGYVGLMGSVVGRNHVITRSRIFMQFDTSGVTAVPLTSKQVDDDTGLVLKITPQHTNYGYPELVAVASNLTGTTTPGLANFRDITNWQVSSSFNFNESVPAGGMRSTLINYTTTDDAWLQSGNGTSHYEVDRPYFLSGTANLAEAMFVSSSVKMALMGYAFDYTSASISPALIESPSALSGSCTIYFAAGGVATERMPTLSYTAGTTTTNILGVSPARQAKVAGVFRGKTEKVGGKK